jgi:valyl-tRNA synthetase
LFRLLHPFVPFVTETLWTALTGGESLVIAEWPTTSGRARDEAASSWLVDIDQLATEVRRFRAAQGLPPGQRVPATLVFDQADGGGRADLLTYGAALTRLEPAGETFTASATLQVALATAGTVTVAVDTSSTIDVAAEIARAVKDLTAAEKEVADCSAKLGNAAFVGKAPEKVVQKIRERAAKANADVARLTERLVALRGSAT